LQELPTLAQKDVAGEVERMAAGEAAIQLEGEGSILAEA